VPEESEKLRREIGFLGAFSMGFADVGADVFLAIGIVTLYAAGYAPFSFLIASICYITTGLVYAELASLYPYAGGGQVYGMRAGGDILGFLVGWAILLDYVLDIGLFSIASAGYLAFIFPELHDYITINLGVFEFTTPYIGVTAFIMVLFLIGINLIGIKESSKFNELLVIVTVFTEVSILILAFLFAFSPERFIEQLNFLGNPDHQEHVFYTGLWDIQTENFIYGITLAMSSFIGIESIAQAAEETRNPWKYLPRSFKYSIITVLVFTLSFSILGLGVLGWEGLANSIYNPIAQITSRIPVIGRYMALAVAFVAFSITLVSTNTGVIGVSRVTYSMSRFKLIPAVFSRLHKKRAVPYVSIIFFGLIGGSLALTGNLEMVAGLYNFGALLSYILVNYSHIRLRQVDIESYRPWKTPINIQFRGKEISIVAVIGLIATASLFTLVVIYHPMGRLLGTLWVVAGFILFLSYRVYKGWGITESISVKILKPTITKIKTIVVVPPLVKPELVYRAIYYNLEDIHDIHLVSLIELPKRFREPVHISWAEIISMKRDVEENLGYICERLRKSGFTCKSHVIVGSSDSLTNYIEGVNADTVVLISGKKPRIKGKKGFILNDLKGDIRIIYLFMPEFG